MEPLSWEQAVPLLPIEHQLVALRNLLTDAPYSHRPQIIDAITQYEMQREEYLRSLGRIANE